MARSVAIIVFAALAVLGGVAPQSSYFPDLQNVYHLFTRSNPTFSHPLLLEVEGLLNALFNPARDTVVLLHGWQAGPVSPSNVAFITSILSAADVNVFAVDWSAGAYLPDYNGVVNDNVPLSANSVARFITWLNRVTGSNVSRYTIIGFEVGAHQAGLVGRNLGGQVPYVLAVNPPRQGWNETNMFLPTDGVYTEAVHSDVFGSGMLEPVAQVDIYPNGGLTMPGCYWADWECSRDRSYLYVAESILSGGFTSVQCATLADALDKNCVSDVTIALGGLTPKNGATGLFTVDTNEQAPFSTG